MFGDFLAKKYRIYTVYIWFWPTLDILRLCMVLANPKYTRRFGGEITKNIRSYTVYIYIYIHTALANPRCTWYST